MATAKEILTGLVGDVRTQTAVYLAQLLEFAERKLPAEPTLEQFRDLANQNAANLKLAKKLVGTQNDRVRVQLGQLEGYGCATVRIDRKQDGDILTEQAFIGLTPVEESGFGFFTSSQPVTSHPGGTHEPLMRRAKIALGLPELIASPDATLGDLLIAQGVGFADDLYAGASSEIRTFESVLTQVLSAAYNQELNPDLAAHLTLLDQAGAEVSA